MVDPATYRAATRDLLKREGVPFWPDAAWRDVVFGAAVVATIVLLALVVGPPELGQPPDPSILEAYPRPDWYFLWYFARARARAAAISRLSSSSLGPLVFGAILLLLPLFNRGARSVRRAAAGRPLLVVFMWTTIVSFWVAGERADWSPDFEAPPLPASVVRSTRPGRRRGRAAVPRQGLRVLPRDRGLRRQAGSRPLRRRGAGWRPIRSRRGSPTGADMPAYARTLTPEQVRTLVAFLSTRGPSSTRP